MDVPGELRQKTSRDNRLQGTNISTALTVPNEDRSQAETHHVCGELGGVVVDVGDPDDGGGGVGQTVGGVPLHVCGLDDQGVLGHFLKTGTR